MPREALQIPKKYQKCLGAGRGCPGSQIIQVYLFIQISVRQSQLSGLPGSQLSNSGKPFRIGTNQEMPGDGYLPNRSPWMPWIPLRIAAKVQVYLFSRHWKGIFSFDLRGGRPERNQVWPSRVYLFSRDLIRLLSGKTLQLQSFTRAPEWPERPNRLQKMCQKCQGPGRGCPGSQIIKVYLFIQISFRLSCPWFHATLHCFKLSKELRLAWQ